MAIVYILQTVTDGRYYVGCTNNINERLKHHMKGYTYSTKRMGKLKIVFTQEYATFKEARKIELKLKKLKRKDYLDKIVKDGYIQIRP